MVKRSNELVKRTGNFGEERCEENPYRVWDFKKDKCLVDEQVKKDYGEEALHCLRKLKWYAPTLDDKKIRCHNNEEKCIRDGGDFNK